MERKEEQRTIQASIPAGMSDFERDTAAPPFEDTAPSVSGASQAQVLVDLLRQVKPLCSERPEDILFFFVRLGDIHALGLADDRVFITRILPLVPAGLLQFLGTCLREGSNWGQCKARLLEEYFPHFVRERLIRDLIIFNFHARGQPMRVYIDQFFQAADFLQYGATEQQLVERIVMNFHPDILSHAAFLDQPRTRRELYRVIGQIEERFSIQEERDRLRRGNERVSSSGVSPRSPRHKTRGPGERQVRCWDCGQLGHVRTNCPSRTRSGNEPYPGSRAVPGVSF